jgi:L-malate glycosyltransferase
MKKLNICFITPEFHPFIGGTANATFDMAKALIKRGHKVNVITPNIKNVQLRETADGINIYRFSHINKRILREINYCLQPFWIIKKINPDIIYSQSAPLGFTSAILGFIYNKLSIVHARGVDIDKTFQSKLKFLIKYAIKYNDYIFALSKDHKTKIQKDVSDDIQIVTNGIKDIKIQKTCNELKKQLQFNDQFNLLYFGRIEDHKGIDKLIKAMALIKDAKITLRIIGTGPDFDKIKTLIKKENMVKHIKLLGKLPRKKVFKYIKASDLCVFPLLRAAGMGNAQLEAMYLKTPIIGTTIGYFPELIGKKRGLLVKSGDVLELKQAIVKLKNSKKLRDTYVKNAFDYVKKNHGWNNIARQIEVLYEKRK